MHDIRKWYYTASRTLYYIVALASASINIIPVPTRIHPSIQTNETFFQFRSPQQHHF